VSRGGVGGKAGWARAVGRRDLCAAHTLSDVKAVGAAAIQCSTHICPLPRPSPGTPEHLHR
jgi:hypothetical protein